jgi:DNA-binding HxlR family transcriptional regulator
MTDYALTVPEAGVSSSEQCPISRALDVVSNRSTFMVLREAFYGTTRFDDFVNRAAISEQIVAARLRALVHEGLLERVPYQEPGRRTRYEYHLTQAGAEFFPVIAALIGWSAKWRGPARLHLEHRDCGAPVRVTLECDRGHNGLTAAEIEAIPNKKRNDRKRSSGRGAKQPPSPN